MFKDKMDESGAYWGFGKDLTKEEKKERKKLLEEKAPYLLCIETNKYTGNFDRELVAYAFGRLDCVQESIHFARPCIRDFWRTAENCSFYEEYIEKYKTENHMDTDVEETVRLLECAGKNDNELMDIASEIRNMNSAETDMYSYFYEHMLCSTYQEVDDWEQFTFYRIGRKSLKDKESRCIFIQLQSPDFADESSPSGRIGKMALQRIAGFFQQDVSKLFCAEYSKLLSLSLINQEGNLLKDFGSIAGLAKQKKNRIS